MGPDLPLPLPRGFLTTDAYVDALLEFVTSSKLLQYLVGGVHILDFFTREPGLYHCLLDPEWRDWFELHDLKDLLDFILREDMAQFSEGHGLGLLWRGKDSPPQTLVQYIHSIRNLSLNREFHPVKISSDTGSTPNPIRRNVAVGMRVKKIHEVDHFARYIHKLTEDVALHNQQKITHLVDFGSGQNYLGRTLMSPPYDMHVVAVESKHHNIEGAKDLDILAKIAPKRRIWRNKKLFRAGSTALVEMPLEAESSQPEQPGFAVQVDNQHTRFHCNRAAQETHRARLDCSTVGTGSVQYVEHRLEDGDLSTVVNEIVDITSNVVNRTDSEIGKTQTETSANSTVSGAKAQNPSLMVMSIHSCGNLSHHGIRSLVLNPSVNVVAIVGCCYNLVSERLTPPSYKHPSLRPQHHPNPLSWYESPQFGDPHGFPMSSRIENFHTPVSFNITARMMAVQAPQNWGPDDSNDFFTRHFYRAVLQKIFLDRGIVELPTLEESLDEISDDYVPDRSVPSAAATKPVIIGRLGKSCFTSFVSYVRGVIAKITKDTERGLYFKEKLAHMEDEEIKGYADRYVSKKKHLSIVWTLMAYSAALVEAVVVVDRWLWLTEQNEVDHAWVEAVFDFKHSPRNLVVVGIKK